MQTDTAAPSRSGSIHATEASNTRLRARRAAETRLKIYGVLAICLAGLALVTLLSTVVGKAVDALTVNHVTLDVHLPADEIDPQGTADPEVIKKANFTGIYKDHLKALFPGVKDRRGKKELYDVVSGYTPFAIREAVLADPSLIGQNLSTEFLASDVADLYLKGRYGALEERSAQSALSVTVDGKKAEVRAGGDDFADALAFVKANLLNEARRERGRAEAQERGRAEFERRLTLDITEAERTTYEAEVASRAATRDKFIAQAEALEARAKADGGTEKLGKEVPSLLIRVGDGWIKLTEVSANGGLGTILSPLGADTLEAAASDWRSYTTELPQNARKVSDVQIMALETLRADGKISSTFNSRFFTSGDSREPELAGIWGAIVGSFWTMLVTFSLAFPIGVLAAIYLEEFAPKNRITDLIEVNINNLAAVPSIVFGLLGLAVFLGVFGVPRSAPLAGGIVLALMTLPTIIIASRAAIRAVPPSIRDAALGVGASKVQTTFHHVLPLAMPGVMTGSIIGMAQALGETAPLIMIGMVAFIVDIPTGITDSASVLPVQIFRWSDFPERAFEARTAAAICVLLAFLIIMNALAVLLRRQFERRW